MNFIKNYQSEFGFKVKDFLHSLLHHLGISFFACEKRDSSLHVLAICGDCRLIGGLVGVLFAAQAEAGRVKLQQM